LINLDEHGIANESLLSSVKLEHFQQMKDYLKDIPGEQLKKYVAAFKRFELVDRV
jgi:hypothetical protein